MSEPTFIHPGRGYVIEMNWVPAGFPAWLERQGLAGMCAHTVDGVYVEPRVPLGRILEEAGRAGMRVNGFRAAGTPPSWREAARPPALAMARLRNARSAEWLPTLPAA